MKSNKNVVIISMLLCTVFLMPIVGASTNDSDWWTMLHHDAQLTGFSTSPSPGTNTVLWQSAVEPVELSSPTVVDDKLYIGSLFEYNRQQQFRSFVQERLSLQDLLYTEKEQQPTRQENGKLFCLDSENGNELWSFPAIGSIESSPAVYGDNVYFSTMDIYSMAEGYLYCLNRESGDELWSVPVLSLFASPIVYEGKIYISSFDVEPDIIGKLNCYNASTGSEEWSFQMEGYEIAYGSNPAIFDNRVYIGVMDLMYLSNVVYCIDAASGDQLWKITIGTSYAEFAPAITCSEETIFISYCETDFGEDVSSVLACFNASDGEELWKYEIDDEFSYISIPAVAYGNVYYASIDPYDDFANFRCLHGESGQLLWFHEIGMMLSSPAVADGKLYLTAWDDTSFNGTISSYDAFDGSLLWQYDIPPTLSSPTIADEKLFVVDYYGTVYAFKDEVKVNISGGFASVKASIENTGDDNISDIDWSITVRGGLLGMINITSTGNIDTLASDSSVLKRAFPVLGFGKIEATMTVTIPDVGRIQETEEGFILGVFVVLYKPI